MHSGGEEVMLDVAGQDATEAFEDVGHSDEARETLEQLYCGNLKRQVCCYNLAHEPGMNSAHRRIATGARGTVKRRDMGI